MALSGRVIRITETPEERACRLRQKRLDSLELEAGRLRENIFKTQAKLLDVEAEIKKVISDYDALRIT